MSTDKSRPAALVKIADGGTSYGFQNERGNACHVSGYGWETVASGVEEGTIAPDAIILDIRSEYRDGPLSWDDLYRLATRGAMVDETLPPGTRLRPLIAERSHPIPTGDFWSAGSLDYVAADLYLDAAYELGATAEPVGEFLEREEAAHLERYGKLPTRGAGRYEKPPADWRPMLAGHDGSTRYPLPTPPEPEPEQTTLI